MKAAPVYPGVAAELSRPFWSKGLDGSISFWRGYIRFVGREDELLAAGLLRAGDRLPKKPRGDSGFATMRFNGELRLKLEPEEAAARDKAFGRFMSEVLAPLSLGRRVG